MANHTNKSRVPRVIHVPEVENHWSSHPVAVRLTFEKNPTLPKSHFECVFLSRFFRVWIHLTKSGFYFISSGQKVKRVWIHLVWVYVWVCEKKSLMYFPKDYRFFCILRHCILIWHTHTFNVCECVYVCACNPYTCTWCVVRPGAAKEGNWKRECFFKS